MLKTKTWSHQIIYN